MRYNTNQAILKRVEELFAKQDKKLQEMQAKILSQIQYTEKLNFAQNESFYWLAKRLNLKNALPPTRGWPMSPDVLLKLHEYVMSAKPKKIVEFGSGVSTLVICDALRQNSEGLLYSIDHSEQFGGQTLQNIKRESLENFVDLRIAPLEPWLSEHIHSDTKSVFWYQKECIGDICDIDLLIVDGPPGMTCPSARYPAVPALYDRLSPNAEVWLDDTSRSEEKKICETWAAKYNMNVKYFPLEKGLSVLIKK
ncbi:MAG: class I SAM-dependent methyltransferase [Campylobacteraceae bacterium]|nr:class I SAM-dependent methyltransferase [Campylobacteraceae bacterium]